MRHRAIGVLLLLAAIASALGNLQAWLRLHEVNAARNPVALAMLVAAASSVPLLLLAFRRWRREPPAAAPQWLWAGASAILLWLAYAAVAGDYHRARVACVVGAWAAGVALAIWRGSTAPRPRPALLQLASFAFALLLGELGLRVAATFWPGPFLMQATAGVEQRLAAYAPVPGQRHFGFAANSLGFYDGDFAPPTARQRPAVAVIGDSFSSTFVPHRRHYTTVAEHKLGDTEVWNVGWPALGPSEYRVLLDRYVLPLEPEAIVVSLFLGNDLPETRPLVGFDRLLANWFDRGNVLLLEVPRRLWRARGHAVAHAAAASPGGADGEPAWVDDPLLEPGTFTPAEFRRLELERAQAATAPSAARWSAFTTELRGLRERAGDRPFGFVLIPDEFMVEDALWLQLEAGAKEPLHRHELRERVLAWCREARIPVLDLWPALTAVPALPDGDRHLYLRRDTHWNARGNAVAGAELARWLRELLARH